MKNIRIILLAIALIAGRHASAQTDEEKIDNAKNAINVAHNCDDALRFLSDVSVNGKMSPDYFLCLAKAHDCKTNSEQAVYYYNKYLELHPNNDSVKKRVAELSDKKTEQSRALTEERIAKENYDNTSKKKRKKEKQYVYYDNYFNMALSYSRATGGGDASLMNGTGIDINFGFPIIKHHLALDFAINSDMTFTANKPWYSAAYNIDQSKVAPGIGTQDDVEFSPMIIIVSKKMFGLAAGPLIGMRYIGTPDATDDGNEATYGNYLFKVCYGAKASIDFGGVGFAYLEYTKVPQDIFVTQNNIFGVNVDHSIMRVGVGIRFLRY